MGNEVVDQFRLKKDWIIAFIESLANTVCDQLLDSSETCFSFYRRSEVFQAFSMEYSQQFKVAFSKNFFLSV